MTSSCVPQCGLGGPTPGIASGCPSTPECDHRRRQRPSGCLPQCNRRSHHDPQGQRPTIQTMDYPCSPSFWFLGKRRGAPLGKVRLTCSWGMPGRESSMAFAHLARNQASCSAAFWGQREGERTSFAVRVRRIRTASDTVIPSSPRTAVAAFLHSRIDPCLHQCVLQA